MSRLLDLRAEIEKQVGDRMVPLLLEKGVEAHKKHWRHCDCSWCRLKQEATVRVGYAAHVPVYERPYYRRTQLARYHEARTLLET